MTAKNNVENSAKVSFDFIEIVDGEPLTKTFSADLIAAKEMTIAAQMRVSAASTAGNVVEATAARISGRLRNAMLSKKPLQLNYQRVLAYLESEDTDTQEFITKLVEEFSIAIGISSREEVDASKN